jgi:hypothetical protein
MTVVFLLLVAANGRRNQFNVFWNAFKELGSGGPGGTRPLKPCERKSN